MSIDAQDRESELPVEDELTALKNRADMIGLRYHPKIGVEKLRAKVKDQLAKDAKQLAKEAKQVVELVEPIPTSNATYASPDKPERKRETPAQKNARLRKKAMRLIRFRLTCMNPNKKGWTVQQFVVSNSAVGSIKRYIPFNAPAWHCEEMLLNSIRDREYVDFYEVKDKKGRPYKKHRLVKEFAVEVLPPLTDKERAELVAQQQASKSIGD